MSRLGRIIAKLHGNTLPEFDDAGSARRALTNGKDATLAAFLSEHTPELALDYSLASLKRIESWFLTCGCPNEGSGGYNLSQAIAFYFGEVLCRTAGFEWVVEEFVFEPAKYEIGVRKDRLTIMLTRGWTFPTTGNARMQSLWRAASRHAT